MDEGGDPTEDTIGYSWGFLVAYVIFDFGFIDDLFRKVSKKYREKLVGTRIWASVNCWNVV